MHCFGDHQGAGSKGKDIKTLWSPELQQLGETTVLTASGSLLLAHDDDGDDDNIYYVLNRHNVPGTE